MTSMTGLQRVQLYLSTEHGCGYLPGNAARNAYVDPEFNMSPWRYELLVQRGFRRSGGYVYRPHCANCRLCIPARIVAADFTPNRSQRRCLQRNADVELRIVDDLSDEHYTLYRRYLAARHPGEGMDADNREAFHGFLECNWGDTQFWEFRAAGRLLAVAVVDTLGNALSAVYTFYDPDQPARSLGTYAVLRQVQYARDIALAHVYLGYWVPQSRKMDYKKNFSALELLGDTGWTPAAAVVRSVEP